MLRNEEIKTLVEALPYLRDFKGKTVVVKYGGNAMLNDDIKTKVLQDIVFLQCAGLRPVVVHGGGPEITAMLGKAGKKTQFVSGLRVTDAESVGIAEMALVGKINTDLVARLNVLGMPRLEDAVHGQGQGFIAFLAQSQLLHGVNRVAVGHGFVNSPQDGLHERRPFRVPL